MLPPKVPKPARPRVPIGLHMIKHPTDGLLFFEGGRELRIVAYDVSRTEGVVHADGLGLLPIHFYITFDNFLTVGKCRLAWRCREDIGVIFERWLDIPPSVSHSTIHSDLSPKINPDASSPAASNLNSSHEHNCSTGPTEHSPISVPSSVKYPAVIEETGLGQSVQPVGVQLPRMCGCTSGSLQVTAAGIATVAPHGDEQVAQQHGCHSPDDKQAAVANF